MERVRVLAVCGPTSSGKSALASSVAARIGAEIVNADSRQIYKDMAIGTGWPDAATMSLVPHHLYGFVAPSERYSAGRYFEDAGAVCAEIAKRGRLPIAVGGTGLYIEALSGAMPFDRPVAGDELRARVRREAEVHPQEALREWLGTLDPAAARRLTARDRYRTLRALEAAIAAREGALAPERAAPLDVLVVVVSVERTELRRRIKKRVLQMFDAGLVDEARAVSARYGAAPALSGIGYAEALAYVRGEMSYVEAVDATIRRTCRYAKRQQTWMRRMHATVVDGSDERTAGNALLEAAREITART